VRYLIYGSVPLSAAACPHFAPRQRQAVVNLGSRLTVDDAIDFLNLAFPRRVNDAKNETLETIFNTERRIAQLGAAIRSFTQSYESWMRQGGRDRQGIYIVPPRLVLSIKEERVTRTFQARLLETKLGRNLLCADTSLSWLALLSLEGVHAVKRLQISDRALILGAFRSGMRGAFGDNTIFPWERVPEDVAALSISWLYAQSPSPRLWAVVRRLNAAGLRSIGHLSVLENTAWQLIRRRDLSQWTALQRSLIC
jgi:hypothetical protein